MAREKKTEAVKQGLDSMDLINGLILEEFVNKYVINM